jgi:hypothetical protein
VTLALAAARIDMDAELRERQISNGFARRRLVHFDDYI